MSFTAPLGVDTCRCGYWRTCNTELVDPFAVDEAVARLFLLARRLTLPHFMLELAHDRWVAVAKQLQLARRKARGRHVAAGLKTPAAVNRFCQGDSSVSLSKVRGNLFH